MGGEPDQVRWRGVQPVWGIHGVWPARDAERIYKSAYKVGLGAVKIYTVPPTKKLFLTTLVVNSRNEIDQLANPYVAVRDAEDALLFLLGYNYYAEKGQINAVQTFCPGVEVEAGWDVYVSVGRNNVTARGIIFGWLEDA